VSSARHSLNDVSGDIVRLAIENSEAVATDK
jgi:hypothetical protein